MVRLLFASLKPKKQKEQPQWQIQKLCRSFSPLLRVYFCWQSSEGVNLLLLEFPKTVRKCGLVERLDLLPMAVLLTRRADCSLFVLTTKWTDPPLFGPVSSQLVEGKQI